MATDAPWVLKRIEDCIVQMDQAPRQVMIEAHVLQITLGNDLRHGINYRELFAIAGSDLEFDIRGFADPLASPAVFARISGRDVTGLLELLKSTTEAKTLASPRVMVVNGQTARIQVGEQLGYKVITITETAAVEEVKFLDVGVVLEVTPRISRVGRVLMRVKPEVSDGIINPDTLLPEEETSELETDVLLADGQGVVIGGLIQERFNDTVQKVPWLGDLHLIGWMFRRSERIKDRTEVIITLVPRICHSELPTTEHDAFGVVRADSLLFDGPLNLVPRQWLPELPHPLDHPTRPLRAAWCGRCASFPCCCDDGFKALPAPSNQHTFDPQSLQPAAAAESQQSYFPPVEY